MLDWLKRWRTSRTLERRPIPDALWQVTLARFAFLHRYDSVEAERLRNLATLFLAKKEFNGAAGFQVDDAMAVAIAAQACLPVLHLGLEWYDGFVGIVVHADAVLARREVADEVGVVHRYDEELAGEAMQGGPVMLSWRDVEDAGDSAEAGYNVVIHEFAHVLDMRDGLANGVPPMPSRDARRRWLDVLIPAFEDFRSRVDAGEETLLDPYAAQAPEEFFAVASEAFFVAPVEFAVEHPDMHALLRRFYRQDPSEGRK